MEAIFCQKLEEYLRNNNPDILITLKEEGRLNDYLRDKVASVDGLMHQLIAEGIPATLIEEHCLDELKGPLLPSRYHYIAAILEEEFGSCYEQYARSGVLGTELLNMIHACDTVLTELHFSSAKEDDPLIRYAVMGVLWEYVNRES